MEPKSIFLSWRLGLVSVFLLLALVLGVGCTGSGAVSPLSPTNATKADADSSSADSDVIYWTSYPVTFGLTDTLNGVFLVSKKLGWACGNNGTILKYDGDTWSKVDTGFAKNQNLYAVTFANESEGWFVGSQGTILHYNNGNWSLDNSPTSENLYSVAVTPSHTVWAVGSNGCIITFNGISWGKVTAMSVDAAGTAPTTVIDDLYSVGLSDQNNGWAVGNRGTILKFDGQKWQIFPGSPSTEKLNSISVISDVQAWIVGAFGTILRFNGTTWTKMGNAFSGFDLYQIFMKSDDDGWAIGQDGTLIYYDGTRWISHEKPDGKPALNAVSFYKNDLGFVVGEKGTILKYQPNGEMAKFSFLFKGKVEKKPTQAQPYYTLAYDLMNQSPKISPLLTFSLPIPKGFEPYQPKATPTATGTVSFVASETITPTPIFSVTPLASPVSSLTPGANVHALAVSSAPKQATGVGGNWVLKDGSIDWEIGTVAASEMKAVTILLQDKKHEKKEWPVIFRAVLNAKDKLIAEAGPVTLKEGDEKVNSALKIIASPAPPVKGPHDDDEDQTPEISSNARPTVTPSGH